jgi:PAS domain-containing protein
MEVGNRRVYEWFQQTKDGRDLPVEISSNVLEFGGHRYNVSSVRDISDRRRTEGEIRDRETRLRQAQRLARLGSFARDMKTDQV